MECLWHRHRLFLYSDRIVVLRVVVHVLPCVSFLFITGVEPTYCMGDDIPLAVLSDKPHMLYDYFKQRFAQVSTSSNTQGPGAGGRGAAVGPL